MNQKNLNPEQPDELSLVKKVIGNIIGPHAENYWMILTTSEFHHLLLLSSTGSSVGECSLIGKSKSNGHQKYFREILQKMEKEFGTMETLEQ